MWVDEPPSAVVVRVSEWVNGPVGKFVLSATAPTRSKFTANDRCSPAANVPELGEPENRVDVNVDEYDTGKVLGLRNVTLIEVVVSP